MGGTLESLALITGMAIAIVIGLAIFRKAQREARGEPDENAEDPLRAIRAAYQAGQMDPAEFERAESILVDRKTRSMAGREARLDENRPRVPTGEPEAGSADMEGMSDIRDGE